MSKGKLHVRDLYDKCRIVHIISNSILYNFYMNRNKKLKLKCFLNYIKFNFFNEYANFTTNIYI